MYNEYTACVELCVLRDGERTGTNGAGEGVQMGRSNLGMGQVVVCGVGINSCPCVTV